MRAANARSNSKPTVLLVDDQQTSIVFTQMLLGREAFDFVVASNGREAVEKARAIRPDLILLDIMMPEMDGITAAQVIRADPDTAAIPIIIVTTRSEVEYVERAYLGGCEYITKPVQKDELLAKIRSAIGC